MEFDSGQIIRDKCLVFSGMAAKTKFVCVPFPLSVQISLVAEKHPYCWSSAGR